MQFWQMILEVIARIWYVFLIILVPIILYLIFCKKIFSFKKPKLAGYIIFVILLLGSLGLIYREVKKPSKDVFLDTCKNAFDEFISKKRSLIESKKNSAKQEFVLEENDELASDIETKVLENLDLPTEDLPD